MSDYYPPPDSAEIYDVFLYSSVADQENGTPISVLTALARGNCDPWEEAARLAKLSPDRAERELVELLAGGVDRKVSFVELEAAAKRLVPMLPLRRKINHATVAVSIGTDAARQLTYWVVWFAIITMLIVAQEHDRRAPMQSDGEWARNTEKVALDAAKQDMGLRGSGQGLSRAEVTQNK